ncbi:hypothetical protein DUI87_06871 [Hirundo rustica rustica]|uniref:Uncharacterized protein n=1 Tax=Hirundo rustica rustica TaxID=333673 RepID=A0A3M0KN83_HIRRU|nr:hypothetical protein DUI87_06871 [Hirundo rustica rustica]
MVTESNGEGALSLIPPTASHGRILGNNSNFSGKVCTVKNCGDETKDPLEKTISQCEAVFKAGHELGMVGIVGIALLPAPNGADHNPAGPKTGTIPSHRQGEDGKQSLEKKTARWP